MRLFARVIEGSILQKEDLIVEAPFTLEGYLTLHDLGEKFWNYPEGNFSTAGLSSDGISKYEIACFTDDGKLVVSHRPDKYNFEQESKFYNLIEFVEQLMYENSIDQWIKDNEDSIYPSWVNNSSFDIKNTYPSIYKINELVEIAEELGKHARFVDEETLKDIIDQYTIKGNPYSGHIFFTISEDSIVCCDNTTDEASVESFPIYHWLFAKEWLEDRIQIEDYQLMLSHKIDITRNTPTFIEEPSTVWVDYVIKDDSTVIAEGTTELESLVLDRIREEVYLAQELQKQLPHLLNKPNINDYSRIMQYLVYEISNSDNHMWFMTKEDIIEMTESFNITLSEYEQFNLELEDEMFESIIEGRLPNNLNEMLEFTNEDDNEDLIICYGSLLTIFDIKALEYTNLIKEKDLDNDGIPERIDIDDTRNSVQTVSDLSEVGNKTQKHSQLGILKSLNENEVDRSIGDKPLEKDIER